MSELPRSRSSRARTAALLVLFAGAFLAIGWSIFWFVAHSIAGRELDNWLAREAQHGRLWTCANRSSGGYPLSIAVDCDQPRLQTILDGSPTTISARRIAIAAPLYTPKLLTADLAGPLEASSEAGLQARADWRSLQLSSRGLPGRLDRLSLVGEGLTLEGRLGDRALRPTKANAIQAHIRRHAPGPGAPYAAGVSVAGVEAPDLDAVTGNKDAAVAHVIGIVTNLDKAVVGTLAERVELWRAAGGRLTVTSASLLKGPLAAQAEGALGLDQSRRLDGKLDLRMTNAGRMALDLAVQAGALRPGTISYTLVRALLGVDKGGETRASVSFENGALTVGPLKGLIALPPLY